MRRPARRRFVRPVIVSIGSLAVATVAIALLQNVAGVPNASVVYLAAVVTTAFVAGTVGAIAAAAAAFLLYDFLFIQPLLTFTVSDPGEWLNLVLLLFTGIIVGQLAALQRARADQAREREREAIALFRVSRELATRSSTQAVLPTIARTLAAETAMARVWIALGPDEARERIAADSSSGGRPAVPGLYQVLQRLPEDVPARWVRVHQPTPGRGRAAAAQDAYQVRIEAGGRVLGSIWALRDRAEGEPDGTETRLLSAAADQVGQAVALDALAAASQAAEVARQSDAIKSALLQSVSHDLRTPLATIRAAAGTLRPGGHLDEEGQRESADAIDREVEYLNRLVTNMLDLSRIEAGALKADRDVFELDDLVGQTLERFGPRLAGRQVDVALEAPPVEADPVFLDSAVTNALENAIKYTPAGTRIRLTATALPDGRMVRLTVEDAGPGVPPTALPRLFEKFYRAPGAAGGSRSGTGVGLAVVKGLVEATGGRVAARPERPRRAGARPGPPASRRGGRAHRRGVSGRGGARGVRGRANARITRGRRSARDRRRRRGGRRGCHRGRGRRCPRGGQRACHRRGRRGCHTGMIVTRPTVPGPVVLIVEDDRETRAALARELAGRGYHVVEAEDGRAALSRWEARRPDVVLLDLGLPDMDGLDIVRRIRRDAATPIVILSGRYEEREKVEALERGADDYVTKPFGVDELNARLRVALRRAAGPVAGAGGRIETGPLVFDATRHEVLVNGTRVDLTPREFEILRVLLTHAGRLVTKGRLLRAVWGEAYGAESSYVYVHVSQVRRKLAAADPEGALRDLIVTEPGVGYRVRDLHAPEP